MSHLSSRGEQATDSIVQPRRNFGALVSLLAFTGVVAVAQHYRRPVTPISVCADLTNDSTSSTSWSLAECIEVWEQWIDTIPKVSRWLYVDRRALRYTGERLRERGSRCFIELPPLKDGIGSSAIRSIVTWVFAEEMGCEWVPPTWGNKRQIDDNGTMVYCHNSSSLKEVASMTVEERVFMWSEVCSVVSWREYFGFSAHAVDLPEDGVVKTVTLTVWREIEAINRALEDDGESGALPWRHLLITFSNNMVSSRFFTIINTWDPYKQQSVRNVMEKMRKGYFEAGLARFDPAQECAYDASRLNFAIHIRMGDRIKHQGIDREYFRLLDLFMDMVTEGVLKWGLPPPLYHVFSETSEPCPPPDTGIFPEFSQWPPVDPDQIQPCYDAETAIDGPEKRAGLCGCRAKRSGHFRLIGRPLLLHVGTDAVSAMSCMVHADGLLMGCSTFGQVAGLLNNGISFFSMRCGGELTPLQYQLVPPIAVAERGELWVPIGGSWRDPMLKSPGIFMKALKRLIDKKSNLAA